MDLVPVTPQWVHTYLLEPYLQGVALLNFAWSGTNQSLVPKEFSLSERIIFWLQGMCLLTPLINTIIWIAWQTFGSPQILADSYSPQIKIASPPLPILIDAPVDVNPVETPKNQLRLPQAFTFHEYSDTDFQTYAYSTRWKVEYYPDMIIAKQSCRAPAFDSSYIYTPDLKLKEFFTNRGHLSFQARIQPNQKIWIHYADENINYEKTIDVPDDCLLIQHPVMGLSNFVLSPEQEATFYAILPMNPVDRWNLPNFLKQILRRGFGEFPRLEGAVAMKKGIETIPGIGEVLKVESWSIKGWPFNQWVAEAWFDPKTGQLVKFINPFTGMSGISYPHRQ